MSFELKKQEPVSTGLRRVFSTELQTAAKGLLPPESDANRDRAIHEARKSVKKSRGVLRLLEPQLDTEYRKVNTRLRGIGRKLSEFRDAGAMLETVELIEKEYSKELGRSKLTALKKVLISEKEKAEHAGNLKTIFEDLAAELQSIAAEAENWKLKGDAFDAIEPGFKKAFRRGRKALDKAVTSGGDVDFHEWRKRVKDHWYHVRLIEQCDKQLGAYEKLLKQLETWLGDDHNLVVLREKLHDDPKLRRAPAHAKATELSIRHRDELRSKAVDLGRELYRVKPGKLARMVRAGWEKGA